jgi:hypothetical protein
MKFQPRYVIFEIIKFGNDFSYSARVFLLSRHLQQFDRIIQPARQFVEPDNDLFELGAFLPERLRTVRIIPYIRYLKFALNFGQPLRLAVVVKDTPLTHCCVRLGQRFAVLSD